MANQRRTQQHIEIQLPKCRVFLTPAEIHRLLQQDLELFTKAIRRGKAIIRARKARERMKEV